MLVTNHSRFSSQFRITNRCRFSSQCRLNNCCRFPFPFDTNHLILVHCLVITIILNMPILLFMQVSDIYIKFTTTRMFIFNHDNYITPVNFHIPTVSNPKFLSIHSLYTTILDYQHYFASKRHTFSINSG
jgi:hypothetical protein